MPHETLAIADMIFVGDALFPGKNDYPAEQAGADIEFNQMRDPHETKRVIEAICACLETGKSHRQMASQGWLRSLFAPAGSEPSPEKARTAKTGDDMGALTQEIPDEVGAVILERRRIGPWLMERRYP